VPIDVVHFKQLLGQTELPQPKGSTIMAGTLKLDKLKIAKSPKPVETRRGRTGQPNPFVDVLRESFTNGETYHVMVDLSGEKNKNGIDRNVVSVQSALTAAAEMADLGVRIQIIPAEKDAKKQEVRFEGKERTRRPRTTAEETAEADVA
jgi:hypothetical protein